MDWTLDTPTSEDAPAIAEIWRSGWHDGHAGLVPDALLRLRDAESFRTRTPKHLPDTRIARIGAQVVGFCMIKDDELYQMYVSATARGTGVAQGLIRDAEGRIAANHKKAWLACAVGNQRAARFYEKSGWTNAGVRSVDLDTAEGAFPLDVWRYEKHLGV